LEEFEDVRGRRDDWGLRLGGGAEVERVYKFILSSELPVARSRLLDYVGGDKARQRMAEVWAAKRKVSEKVTSGLESVPFWSSGRGS
jgi:hypothetical protein